MSPISSRNNVPPSASSNFPSRSANAPVKLPFMWPNSSLSISSPGIAAQFTSTNGPWARGDSAWIARATSSLPVPFSPRISTRAFEGATFSIRSITCLTPLLEPTISYSACTTARSRRFSLASSTCCRAFRSVRSTRSVSRGFSRKSYAPCWVASTAVWIVPCPEIITICAW